MSANHLVLTEGHEVSVYVLDGDQAIIVARLQVRDTRPGAIATLVNGLVPFLAPPPSENGTKRSVSVEPTPAPKATKATKAKPAGERRWRDHGPARAALLALINQHPEGILSGELWGTTGYNGHDDATALKALVVAGLVRSEPVGFMTGYTGKQSRYYPAGGEHGRAEDDTSNEQTTPATATNE
jgi:hypothetical protein